MDLVLATRNKDKVREIKQILGSLPLKILSLRDLPSMPPVKENGKTFAENAIKKARALARRFKKLALADDSGLEVDCLHGAPGIKSARFAGPGADSPKLCKKLLHLMRDVPPSQRKAHFVCVIAICQPSGKVHLAEGTASGKITFEMRGKNGFGYDPVFIPAGHRKTFAEMPPLLKNRLSHRGRAVRGARQVLEKILRNA